MQDGNAVPAADLAADGAHPHGRTAGQDPVAALRRPDDMEPVVMDAMHGAIILHVPVLPERFGNWNGVSRRFRRWTLSGVSRRVSDALPEESGPGCVSGAEGGPRARGPDARRAA